MNIDQGARIIVEDWLDPKSDEVLHYICDETNTAEAQAFMKAAQRRGAITKISVVDSFSVQLGQEIEKIRQPLSLANVIIGATKNSFITTNAVQYAQRCGARFLSLPLSANDNTSLFEQEFLRMDPRKAAAVARPLVHKLNRANTITATTSLGTDIMFSKRDRPAQYFNGVINRRKTLNSASFEVYVPVVENSANGKVVLDGSLGYIGLVSEPLELFFRNGYLYKIGDTVDGVRLREYLSHFNDAEMYCAAEFGIGMNQLARCRGASYIEDESAFGTFHIGLGRNIALGGTHDANGHFDIVVHQPDIYADTKRIFADGKPV